MLLSPLCQGIEDVAGFRNVNSGVYRGIITRDGRGKSRDPKTAYFWLTLAEKIKFLKAGQKESSDFAAEIANEVSPKDRKDVVNAVAAWLDAHPPIASVSIPPIQFECVSALSKPDLWYILP